MLTKRRPNPLVKGIPLISYFSGLRKNDRATVKDLTIPISEKQSTRARLFYPANRDPKDLPGIYMPHGMNVLGIDDERMMNLAKNIALSGYSVLTPEIEEVRSLKIEEKIVEIIISQFRSFYQREDLHKKDNVSFLSVSFSGTLGMISFSQNEVRSMVRSSMVIGSCANFIDTFEYAIENFLIDNYAGIILFYNYLHFLDRKLHSQIAETLFEYAVDNGLIRTGEMAMGPKLHKNLKLPAREFMSRLMEDDEFRLEISSAIRETLPTNLARNLSPYYHIANFKSPLSLLHGSTDPVISPMESRKIHQSLANRNHSVHLEISDLITHGDQVPLYSQIRGVPGVARAFGYYFSWI